MSAVEERIEHYRDIRKNTILWGSIYTSLALLLTIIARFSSDSKTSEAGIILTLAVAGTALLVLAILSIKLKRLHIAEKSQETLPA